MKYIFLEMVADHLSKHHQDLFVDIVNKISKDVKTDGLIFSKEDIIEAKQFLQSIGILPGREVSEP